MRVPWTVRSNQSILKEINPEYSLETLMLKLDAKKLHYFGHLMWKADSLEKTPMLGKIEGKRRRGKQRDGWLDSLTDSTDMSLSKLQEIVKDKGVWHTAVHRAATERWTTTKGKNLSLTYFHLFHLFSLICNLSTSNRNILHQDNISQQTAAISAITMQYTLSIMSQALGVV